MRARVRDSKTEVRRRAMKSIQRFGRQAAMFVPDIIMLTERVGVVAWNLSRKADKLGANKARPFHRQV